MQAAAVFLSQRTSAETMSDKWSRASARPGGNITGVSCLSAELATKRIELLKAAVPSLRRIGFLSDSKPGQGEELAEV
jgi:ABC-type uncharacterized transport system substrate-binding protein